MFHTRKLVNPCHTRCISKFCPENGLYTTIQTSGHLPRCAWIHRIFSIKKQNLNGFRGFASNRHPEDRQSRSPSPRIVQKAQVALLDYLHSTRGVYFTDAERISKNCPNFICRILEKVEDEVEIERALVRLFGYHPINEFEPFFESIGLKPSEYKPFLSRELMFLSDVSELLNNYHDLCDYGIVLSKIGKIYKEAKDLFLCGPGLLKSKLLNYEQLGLSKSTVIKLVSSAPTLLLGDNVDHEFVQLLGRLDEIGFPRDWFGGCLSEKNTCYWGKMLVLLQFFIKDMGFNKKKVVTLISKHPDFLLDCSGKTVFSMISLLLKIGVPGKEIVIMFSEFPHHEVGSFTRNLWRAFQFLVEIGMNPEDIKNIICHHKDSMGVILLKKPASILAILNTGKRRLCNAIIEDPCILQKFSMGMKAPLFPKSVPDLKSIIEKKNFLSHLGFVENSKEMEEALHVFRGKGDELQDRFNFFVRSGLDPSVVPEMLKRAPHILNQKVEVLDEKLSFIINTLGYPLSSVARFPQCLSCTSHRVKLRHLMYVWLKERGKASPTLALGTIVACSDKLFIKKFVNLHPEGPEAWENFKRVVYLIE
ncbi:hypothetical protein KSP40_PGU000148 [Platanthera guangdongensis]|uniref:Uncharacterized protein n=1 Tax=Platanthera guangdongensis TaxID=2320717 RepID=A0ABR2M7J7_9ASPA